MGHNLSANLESLWPIRFKMMSVGSIFRSTRAPNIVRYFPFVIRSTDSEPLTSPATTVDLQWVSGTFTDPVEASGAEHVEAEAPAAAEEEYVFPFLAFPVLSRVLRGRWFHREIYSQRYLTDSRFGPGLSSR